MIIGIAVPSYLAARKSGAETAAAGNVKTMAANAAVFQSHHGVFPVLAGDMKGAETAATVASVCAADEELSTVVAPLWDTTTFSQSGYLFHYKSGGADITPATGCVGKPIWDATAVPTDVTQGSRSFCGDPTGLYMFTGIGAVADGTGCGAQLYTIPVQ